MAPYWQQGKLRMIRIGGQRTGDERHAEWNALAETPGFNPVPGKTMKAFQRKALLDTSPYEDLRYWGEFQTDITKIPNCHPFRSPSRNQFVAIDLLDFQTYGETQRHVERRTRYSVVKHTTASRQC
jgi:hypothetical protein